MKNLGLPLVFFFSLFVLNRINAQQDSCSMLNKNKMLNEYFSTVVDSIKYDLINSHYQDPPYDYNKLTGAPGDPCANCPYNRLIYFVHGLGGSSQSWSKAYNYWTVKHGTETGYVHYPVLIYYNLPAINEFHQQSFFDASLYAYQRMQAEAATYYQNYQDFQDDPLKKLYGKPYAIGHSQGGLVLRDIAMKNALPNNLSQNDPRYAYFDYNLAYNPSQTPPYTNQKFFGIITFGTPHAGAKIADAQTQITELGVSLGIAAINNGTAAVFSKIDKIFPIGILNLSPTLNSTTSILSSLSDDLVNLLIPIVGKGRTDPITKQYTPDAPYLNNYLNTYNDPNMPKSLFYGEEVDPVFWRMAQYILLGDAANENQFEANEDSKLMNAVVDILSNLDKRRLDIDRDIQNKKAKLTTLKFSTAGSYFFGRKTLQGDIEVLNTEKNKNLIYTTSLLGANLKYKLIIGATQESTVITGTRCHCDEPLQKQQSRIYNGKVDCATLMSCTDVETDYIYEIRFNEYPSDGTVLASSQRAFPGCMDKYKILMPGTNHLQMRNSTETKKALWKVYDVDAGDIVDSFFRLHKF